MPVMERKSARPTGSEVRSIMCEEARWRLVLPAVVSATAFAMNAWPIQSQWGIAIAVIASEHPVAPMLQRQINLADASDRSGLTLTTQLVIRYSPV